MTQTNQFSIAISGEWPGAGQTTTAKMVAKELEFIRVYAGFLFRKFAFIWDIQQKHQTWTEFQQSIIDNSFDLDSIPFQEKYFNQKTLSAWQEQLKKVNDMEVWDKIIDTQSLKALSKPGVVVEGKVAVVLDKINLNIPTQFNHPVIKVLLTCPPKVTAQRIIQRKIYNQEIEPISPQSQQYVAQVEATKAELVAINNADWKRYQEIYGVSRQDLYDDDIYKINTENKNEQEVLAAVLNVVKPHLH